MDSLNSIAWQTMQLWRCIETFLGVRDYFEEEWFNSGVRVPYSLVVMHEATLYDLVGTAARLGDPPAQGQYENMSIQRFVTFLLEEMPDAKQRLATKTAFGELERLVQQREVREFRNRIVAHTCAKTAVRQLNDPLISRELMGQIIESAAQALSIVEELLPPDHREDLGNIRSGLRSESFELVERIHTALRTESDPSL